MDFKSVKGFWFPDGARDIDYEYSLKRVSSLKHAISLCRNKRSVVQAGGSYGVWPSILAKHFDHVYTFEPDWISFQCLVRNCCASNVFSMNSALSNKNKMVSIQRNKFTCHRINDSGYIPSITIDSLKMVNCDAIMLDIEGFELFALKGAKYTIQEYRPLILFEDRPEMRLYYRSELVSDFMINVDKEIYDFMDKMDYVLIKDIGADKIYLPKEIKI